MHSTVCKQSYTIGKFVVRIEDSSSFIHPPAPRQVSGSKGSRKRNYLRGNAKKRQKWHCPPSVRNDTEGPWERRHPWEQPVYTMTCIVHSLYCDFESEATYSPVLWFRSLVSCPPGFCCEVCRPLLYLSWSVIEKLGSPGKFCIPPIMVAHKEPSPVLLCLIILSPLLLCLGWCTLVF